jgi:hypothetical protein
MLHSMRSSNRTSSENFVKASFLALPRPFPSLRSGTSTRTSSLALRAQPSSELRSILGCLRFAQPSERRLREGLAMAAFSVWKITVSSVISNTVSADSIKGSGVRSVLYLNIFNQ